MARPTSASCLISSGFDEAALQEAASGCLAEIGGDPDLVFAFVSSDYRSSIPALVESLQIDGHAARIVGCSATGLFGVGREQERAKGVSLLFLRFPETTITMSHSRMKPPTTDSNGGAILLGNPLATSLEAELCDLNTRQVDTAVVGGLVTGGPEEEDLFLFTEKGISRDDYLAVSFSGGVRLRTIVSQGCRPIGEPLIVTRVNREQIVSIGRREAFRVLEETWESLPASERSKADGNIFAGIAMTETVENLDTGHFLIRPIVGADLKAGHLTLGSAPRVGQTLQFQLRDPLTAEENLEAACSRLRKAHGTPLAALVFGGQGRGRNFFGEADHDAKILEDEFEKTPLAGIFTNGEIGPVVGSAFRHDHTLTGAFFYEVEES